MDRLLGAALEVSKKAGAQALKKFGNIKPNFKHRADLVTEADVAANRLIVDFVRRKFPGHSVLSEEMDLVEGESGYCWIVDPIDGTTNFVQGIPDFAVSIGIAKDCELVAAVVHAPALKETYYAQKGKGAFLNGKRTAVTKTGLLKDAVACFDFPYDEAGRNQSVEMFARFANETRYTQTRASAALGMAWVARGLFDLYGHPGTKPWDSAAGALLIREAGGKVLHLDGKEWHWNDWKKGIVCGNGKMCRAFLEKWRG